MKRIFYKKIFTLILTASVAVSAFSGFISTSSAAVSEPTAADAFVEAGAVSAYNSCVFDAKDSLTICTDVNNASDFGKVKNKNNEVVGTLKTKSSENDWKNFNDNDVDKSKIKWSIVKPSNLKAASNAGKFLKNGKYSVASIQGNFTEVSFGDMRSDGVLNNTGLIRATVEIPEKDAKGKIISRPVFTLAEFTVYVRPEFVTEYKELTVPKNSTWDKVYNKLDKFTYSLSQPKTTGLSGNTVAEYDLKIYEGVSYKLPFAAANGQNKALYYDTSESTGGVGFTVVNGIVKALPGGAGSDGVIDVYPQDRGDGPRIRVNVHVLGCLKTLRSSVSTIYLLPTGQLQYFTISANPITSGTYDDITVTMPDGYLLWEVKHFDPSCVIKSGSKISITGSQQFEVRIGDPVAAASPGAKKIEFTYKPTNAPANAKPKKLAINLRILTSGVYDNIKSVRTTGRINKDKNAIELNVPVGSRYNLGISTLPVTANNDFAWNCDGIVNNIYNDNYNVGGDVFEAKKPGKYVLSVEAQGKHTNYKNGCPENQPVKSSVDYIINSYIPGSSIVWRNWDGVQGANNDYTLRGGFLVENGNDTVKTLTKGQKITILAPELKGAVNESVTWKSNNPGALYVAENSGKLDIYPAVSGTYTVTGISNITNQRFTFKVVVGENMPKGSENNISLKDNKGRTVAENSQISIELGQTLQVFADCNGVCAKRITWKADPTTNKGYISVSNGLITARKATSAGGYAKVTATLTNGRTADSEKAEKTISFYVNVTAKAQIIDIKGPDFVEKGKKITGLSVISKNISGTPTWQCIPANGGAKKELDTTKGINDDISGSKEYWVFPDYGARYILDNYYLKKITVYEHLATMAKAIDSDEHKLADLKGTRAGQGIGNKVRNPDGTINKNELVTFDIPILVQYKDASDKNKIKSASDAPIDWTSSNAYIASAVDKPNTASVEGVDRYVTITVCNDHTGKVTLTGTTRNGGKKINIILNVVEG